MCMCMHVSRLMRNDKTLGQSAISYAPTLTLTHTHTHTHTPSPHTHTLTSHTHPHLTSHTLSPHTHTLTSHTHPHLTPSHTQNNGCTSPKAYRLLTYKHCGATLTAQGNIFIPYSKDTHNKSG